MKILKLLSKKKFSIILFLFILSVKSYAEDQPVDIWSIEKSQNDENSEVILNDVDNQNLETIESNSSIYDMQSQKKIETIELDQTLESKKIKIDGLYDPEDYGLNINMWTNSNGDQLKNIFSKLLEMKLSEDAKEIMKISLLTNAYYPNKNITEKEFLKFKSEWLIKNSDLNLIEDYLVKNQLINMHTELTRYLVDQYLSQSNEEKACSIFSKNSKLIDDQYLSKFNIYCLFRDGKNDEAQLNLDLKKELGFKDKYFEKKMNILFGFDTKIDESVSEKSILDFHLAHKTNPKFFFEPKENTDRLIWKYLSSSNLLYDIQEIKITELDKISLIEKATHDRNYPEKDLFELYKRFQFNINQLLNAKNSYKSLSDIEGRALIYQKILLESEITEKLELLKILKGSFKDANINNAFDTELKIFLKEIDPTDVPDNLTSFYYTNIKINEDIVKKIKFNNNVLHQSKLINYFNGDYAKSKIEKDTNNFIKKIKKDKKYFISKKDIIFLESLKSDGIEILKKYEDIYEVDDNEIPTDMQVMINNNESGAILLRIVEVIGQDKIERIDDDTLYFIISALNKLNIDFVRNKILMKVLPLKV